MNWVIFHSEILNVGKHVHVMESLLFDVLAVLKSSAGTVLLSQIQDKLQ